MIEKVTHTSDGRRLRIYDSGESGTTVVFWQHGGGMTGLPPQPFLDRARARGIRVVSYDRPGYGGSQAQPGRTIKDGASDAAVVLDELDIASAVTIGLSAGGMHALASVAIHPDRFTAAISLCGPAPRDAAGLDWFAGMADANRAEFAAALAGRGALEDFLARDFDFDPGMFAAADLEAMDGPYWDWQVATAEKGSPEGTVEDELATVSHWGFAVSQIRTPVLVIHGVADTFVPVERARWIARTCADSTLMLQPGGHISTIPACERGLDWAIASGVF